MGYKVLVKVQCYVIGVFIFIKVIFVMLAYGVGVWAVMFIYNVKNFVFELGVFQRSVGIFRAENRELVIVVVGFVNSFFWLLFGYRFWDFEVWFWIVKFMVGYLKDLVVFKGLIVLFFCQYMFIVVLNLNGKILVINVNGGFDCMFVEFIEEDRQFVGLIYNEM